MTVSPESHSETEGRSKAEDKYANVTEGDVAQRPEEESTGSRALKIFWVAALITVGIVGIYVAVVLFSVAVQAPVEGPNPEVEQRQQTPAEEADQPLEEVIPTE
jgi:hypothetical protein